MNVKVALLHIADLAHWIQKPKFRKTPPPPTPDEITRLVTMGYVKKGAKGDWVLTRDGFRVIGL